MKKTLLGIVALLLVFGVTGCVNPNMFATGTLNDIKVYKSTGKIDGELTTWYLYMTKPKGAWTGPIVDGLSVLEKQNGTRTYYIELSSPNTKNLENITLTVDGNAFLLPLTIGNTSYSTTSYGAGAGTRTTSATHTLNYLLSPQALMAIQNATAMELKYNTSTYTFADFDIANLKILIK